MENKELDQKLREALALHDEGKSYEEIRNHFIHELDDDTISYLIRLVDEFALKENQIAADIKKAKFKMQVGVVAFFLAALLMYKFYINNALAGTIGLLAYLPMIFAIYLLWKGYKEELTLKKTTPEIDDTKFRMKKRKKK
jgi:hypothetical protein